MKKATTAKNGKTSATKIMCLVLAGLMVVSAASTIIMFIAASI